MEHRHITVAWFGRDHSGFHVPHTLLCKSQSSVDVDCETEHMVTPLHYATNRGHWSAVEILVGWGAVLNSTDAKGDTPLSNVVKGKKSTLPISPQLLKVR